MTLFNAKYLRMHHAEGDMVYIARFRRDNKISRYVGKRVVRDITNDGCSDVVFLPDNVDDETAVRTLTFRFVYGSVYVDAIFVQGKWIGAVATDRPLPDYLSSADLTCCCSTSERVTVPGGILASGPIKSVMSVVSQCTRNGQLVDSCDDGTFTSLCPYELDMATNCIISAIPSSFREAARPNSFVTTAEMFCPLP